MTLNNNKQYGAVSLFVVVFAALLITIVTVSFVRMMVQDQQQASTTDLSQSAYDSAQAGVEDAKRALLRYQNACSATGDPADCASTKTAVNSFNCNDAVKTLVDVQAAADASQNGEINVQIAGEGNDLDQAYTCVKINMQTDNYLGELGQDTSKVIPLVGVSDFNAVKIEWFSPKDLAAPITTADIPTSASGVILPGKSSWAPNRPPIMRAQLIQFSNAGFSLDDFEGVGAGNGSNNTIFLYPSDVAIADTASFSSDIRKTPEPLGLNAPSRVTCNKLDAAQEYACSVTLTLPAPSGIDHTQYLNLSALYNKANYRVSLMNGALPVMFNGVQPSIDSTGRANDLFRRVETRVELTDINFPYPNAEVNINGSLCKDFTVTDDVAGYKAGSCTP